MSAALRLVLDRVKKAKPSGSGYVAICPAHDDKQPSLSITVGASGNVLLNCHAGCSYEAIVGALGIDRKELTVTHNESGAGRLELVATYTYRNPDSSLFARKQRFVDDVGAKTFRWSRPDPDHEGQWIPGGSNAPLYRLPELIAAPPTELVVIVEGEKDADRLASLGFVSTTTSNGAGSRWRDDDSRYFAGRRVCIIADDDEPGRKKASETRDALANVAAAVGVVTMPNPNRIKGFDASDYLDGGGSPEQLRGIIERFDEPQMPAEVVKYEILTERVLELWTKGGDEPGVYPGWRSLAKHYRPKTGQLTIVTGAPNAGKSTWLDDLVIRTSCADEDGSGESCARWRWVVFSAEQFPPERHAALLLQKLCRKPFAEGRTARISETEVRVGLGTLREYVTLLDPSFGGTSLERILEVTAELNARRRRDALLIDPYNVLAATSRTKNETEHEFINTALTRLRSFAQSERMHVVVVAHPTKLRRENEGSEYPRVRPWDISGSAHWFNHADAIVSLWRAMLDDSKAATGEVEFNIAKIRFQPECGQLGVVNLFFDRVTTRYLDQPLVRPARPRTDSTAHQTRLAPWEAPADELSAAGGAR